MQQALQRAEGSFSLSVARQGERTHLQRLGQAGCLKLLFPHADTFEAVLLNTGGGIAAGDRHRGTIACGAGASLVLTGQAAERCYRARPGEAAASVSVTAAVAAGARLEWLPQELIVFDGAALDRTLSIDMAADATVLCVESRILGRQHSGERVRTLRLQDRLAIRRGGLPLFDDRLRLQGAVGERLAGAAAASGAIASATIVHVSPEPERQRAARLDAVRAALAGEIAGVSAWNGMLVARMIGHDPSRHRQAVLGVLNLLRDGRPAPSVWRC